MFHFFLFVSEYYDPLKCEVLIKVESVIYYTAVSSLLFRRIHKSIFRNT